MTAATVRVAIVDDHAVFAQALARALEQVSGVETSGVAYTLADGGRLIDAAAPDVAVVDYRLPDGRGTDLVRAAARRDPPVPVVILTASADEAAFLDALDAGCAGYVTKDRSLEEVVDVLLAAAAGELAVPRAMLERVLPRLRRDDSRRFDLTDRELQVLSLVAQGRPNKTIAADLGLRLNTVRNHVQKVLNKLGAHSKLEAVAIATRSGLLPDPREPP